MTGHPAHSVRDALAAMQLAEPERCHRYDRPISSAEVAGHFAAHHAGIPANGAPRSEDVVLYRRVEGSDLPVLVGLFGDPQRVRAWLPGLPARSDRGALDRLLAESVATAAVAAAPCQERVEQPVRLSRLPALQATPRDAGPYLTMGLVQAGGEDEGALSVHRMLIVDAGHLTIWMLPSRRLKALYQAALARGGRLPLTINIGAPPAAMVAGALSTRHLPRGRSKLGIAGALAGRPIAVSPAVSQPGSVLADSEIVLEGYLDGRLADECRQGTEAAASLPEFLGYDGRAQRALPVVTVTAMTMRADALYQAVIGPGREQSTILGLAGALTVALAADPLAAALIRDVHFAAAGGGMLLLFVQVRKTSAAADLWIGPVARGLFERHGMVKLIVFVDEDVNIASTEDVFWALTTRANLGGDCRTLRGFEALAMDPSQGADWLKRRGCGPGTRSFIDATIPHALRMSVSRSFTMPAEAAP